MNRRKKIKTILTKRAKQANLKDNPKKAKPKYISKAERAKIEADADQAETAITTETTATEAENNQG